MVWLWVSMFVASEVDFVKQADNMADVLKIGSEISPNIDKKINLEMDSEICPTDEKTGLKLTQKSAM